MDGGDVLVGTGSGRGGRGGRFFDTSFRFRGVLGFTENEVEELRCQGMSPLRDEEEECWAVLKVLFDYR